MLEAPTILFSPNMFSEEYVCFPLLRCSCIHHSLVRPSFLSRLFEYRHVCNLTAANTLSQSEHSVFISWTDVAIARLGEAILWVGGGCVLQNVKCSKSAEELALDAFMNSPAQKEKLVRVASQLPGYLLNFPVLPLVKC